MLPASTLTHLGIFGNGRFFTSVLSFLKSQDLAEAKERAERLEVELNKVIPTFVKRNKEYVQWKERDEIMRVTAAAVCEGIKPQAGFVTLVKRGTHLDEIVSNILFPYTNVSLQQILERVEKMPNERKEAIIKTYAGERKDRRDRTGRGIEAGYPYTFDLVGSYAEYRDLQRHRMLTQQRQTLTTEIGFIMPPEMTVVGLGKEVERVVAQMEDLNSDIRHVGLRTAAQYATLFNHRMRFILGMNLREVQHLAELRTQPAGHFSYRGMAMEMARKVTERDPWAANTLQFVDYSDPENKIARAKEQSRIAGKNLAKDIDDSKDFM